MDNQHRMISGYRDLPQEDIDLINEIKEHGLITKALIAKVNHLLETQSMHPPTNWAETEPRRWLAIARTHQQEGQSALVRAVAQPEGF